MNSNHKTAKLPLLEVSSITDESQSLYIMTTPSANNPAPLFTFQNSEILAQQLIRRSVSNPDNKVLSYMKREFINSSKHVNYTRKRKSANQNKLQVQITPQSKNALFPYKSQNLEMSMNFDQTNSPLSQIEFKMSDQRERRRVSHIIKEEKMSLTDIWGIRFSENSIEETEEQSQQQNNTTSKKELISENNTLSQLGEQNQILNSKDFVVTQQIFETSVQAIQPQDKEKQKFEYQNEITQNKQSLQSRKNQEIRSFCEKTNYETTSSDVWHKSTIDSMGPLISFSEAKNQDQCCGRCNVLQINYLLIGFYSFQLQFSINQREKYHTSSLLIFNFSFLTFFHYNSFESSLPSP